MKIGIIGATGHIDYAFSGLEAEDRIVGVAPGSAGESVEGLRQRPLIQAQQPEFFDGAEALFVKARPDVVAIACHFADHAWVAIAAMRRGIHVLLEKPVALTLEDLARLREAHWQAQVHFSAMHALRYDAAFHAAWHAVRAGAIGEIRLLTAQKSYKLGRRPDYYTKRATYGGTIPWVGSHAIDWLYWFGNQRALSVYAAHSVLGNEGHGELEATALCLFRFPNEVTGAANIDYLRPATAPTHGDDRLRVAGTRGVIEVRGGAAYLINEKREGVQTLPEAPPRSLFGDFLNQIRGVGHCLVSAADAFDVTEACLLARQSADEKRVVEFPGR